MLIDTHCHLNFQAFEKDLEEVIARAKSEDVEKIIIPGAKVDSSEKAIEIAQKYHNCYAAIGIHPHHITEVSKYQSSKVLKEKIIALAKNKKVVAIGECGLDYFEYQKTVYPDNKITPEIKKQQKELLKMQLEVAIESNLPVILHCREAFSDMLAIVEEYQSKPVHSVILGRSETTTPESNQDRFWTSQNDVGLRGVFHCFGGNKDDLKKVLAMGFYVGFDGNLTFKNAQSLRDLVKLTPLERMLMETDSPYLSPEPYRGERNEPKNVKIIVSEIAQITGIKVEEVEKVTTSSARKLFTI